MFNFKRLLASALTFLALAPSAVLAQTASTGTYVYPSNASISSPTQGSTWNFNSTDLNAYVYDYTGNWQRRTLPKLQLAGVGAPTATTDTTLGYAPGSLYFDTSGLNLYVCTVSTASAAVWSAINNRTSPTDLANAIQGKLTVADFCSDYLVSGSLATTSGTLSTTTGVLVAYVTGLRQVTTSAAYTYTASKDTYDYLQSNGTWLHVAVTNGSAAPTGQPGLAIQKVVSGASTITSVTQLASSYPVFNVAAATASTNNAIPINQADGRYCASGGSNAANQFYATPYGSSGTVSLRNLNAADILFNLPVAVGGLGAPVTGATGNSLVGNGSGYSEITAPSSAGAYFWQNNGSYGQGFWATLPVVSIALGGLGAATSATNNGFLIGNGSTYTQLAAPATAGQFIRYGSAVAWSPAPTGSYQFPYWNGSTDYAFLASPTVTGTSPTYNGSAVVWSTPSGFAVAPGGRLTTASGVPVNDTSSSGVTTIYYTPYLTNAINIGGVNQTFSEASLALSTSANTAYEVIATSASSTTITLSVSAWSNQTTQPTRYLYNGQYYHDSGHTQLIVGGINCITANTVLDFTGARNCSNMFNEVVRPMLAKDATVSWTAASTTPVAANGSTVNGTGQCQVFSCIQREPVSVRSFAMCSNSIVGGTYINIAVDGTTAAAITGVPQSAGYQFSLATSYSASQLGLHTYARQNYVSGGTGTFYGGISGFMEGTCSN